MAICPRDYREVSMAGIRYCKICGEPYEYCKTEVPAGTNRWQDVACCVEHATEYFKQIAISRGEAVVTESKPTVANVDNESDEFAEIEDLFEEIIVEDKEDSDDIEDDSDDEE